MRACTASTHEKATLNASFWEACCSAWPKLCALQRRILRSCYLLASRTAGWDACEGMYGCTETSMPCMGISLSASCRCVGMYVVIRASVVSEFCMAISIYVLMCVFVNSLLCSCTQVLRAIIWSLHTHIWNLYICTYILSIHEYMHKCIHTIHIIHTVHTLHIYKHEFLCTYMLEICGYVNMY